MLNRLFPLVLLAALGLAFFHDLVLHPNQVLYSDYSDLLPLHLPSKYFLVKSWQETGELPLWSPHSFSGLPFIHDTQVSAFYPPHWALFLLSPEKVGAGLSWLVLLHVLAAGWCMYAYARGQGLDRPAAFVAGLGYMFAGKWLIHVLTAGHYNMVPLAWLPLVLLWLEQALRRRSLVRAAWAGAAFALFILCAYPYVTLYAGLYVALWSLGTALEQAGFFGDGPRSRRRTWTALARWVGYGACTALVGVALGAVQLLPSLEAAPEATRSLGVAPSRQMFIDSVHSLFMLGGRAVVGNAMWESEGGLGLLWVAAAVLAPLLRAGKPRYWAAVTLGLLAYALGGAVLLQGLPGFNLFRLPTRMLLLIAFPVALLAGVTTQALFSAPGLTAKYGPLCRQVLLRVAVVCLILQGGYALLRRLQGQEFHLAVYWLVVPFSLAAAYGLFGRGAAPSRWRGVVWAALLLIDLWTLTGDLAVVRPWEVIFTPDSCVQDLAKQVRATPGRVLDREPPRSTSTPLWPALPELLGLESAGGFNPTDVRRYKEYLQFITDRDEPLRPPQGPFTAPVSNSFVIKNKPLLDLLGVRYLLQPAGLSFEAAGEKRLDADARWQKLADDPSPHGFDFIAGGMQQLPPYTLYENRDALPRAFVVHEAAALPERSSALAALKATDFRRQVLLERLQGTKPVPLDETDLNHSSDTPAGARRSVRISNYRPNQVTVQVAPGQAGYLVLTDLWFPGWTCIVGGQAAEVYRANYLFRAVKIAPAAQEVVFTFAPKSYARGKAVSGVALLLLAGWSFAAVWPRRKKRESVPHSAAAADEDRLAELAPVKE
jgi:hypothetical protein